LIDESNHLWSFRALMYDALKKQNFQIKIALAWIINFLNMGWFWVGALMENLVFHNVWKRDIAPLVLLSEELYDLVS
jgi:hypothetical protein